MNESIELIGKKEENKKRILKQNLNLRVKFNKNYSSKEKAKRKYIAFSFLICIIVSLSIVFYFKFFHKKKINKERHLSKKIIPKQIEQNETISEKEKKPEIEEIYKSVKEYETNHTKTACNNLDPINIFKQRLNEKYTTLCEGEISRHICYRDNNPIFAAKNGVLCEFNNIIIDPSKWRGDGNTYKGPMDPSNRGCPLLDKGFFNAKCDKGKKNDYQGYDFIYNNYFNGWDYESEIKDKESIEELAPNKTVFFISRNQDSPNLYHGGSEFVNALAIMYLYNLHPEDIQVVFLESILILDDPFYDLYKNLIGRGGEPIHVRNLTKKYHVSSGIHIPINWDSPCFILSSTPECEGHPTKTYYLYNKLIDLYMSPNNYTDTFISNNDSLYYPESIINTALKENKKFDKIVTFQWRRPWPKGRKGQQRILGNGPELADKLSTLLPKNILLRLVDTASLPIKEQISIMRSSDYFVGIHGAGLSLSIFTPINCIYHEVLHKSNMNGLALFASTSGHKVYKDIIDSDVRDIDGNENIFFNIDEFANKVIERMKENNFF